MPYAIFAKNSSTALICSMNQPYPSWIYFSRQERKALYFLLTLLVLNLITRYWIIPQCKTLPTPQWKEFELVDKSDSTHPALLTAYVYDTTVTHPKPASFFQVLEINTADSASLEKLPMIGGFLAQRIIDYRTALGGYHSLDQLLEIKYLKESTWEGLKSKWKCNGKTTPLYLNSANIETLALHPYLDYSQARRLVNYRIQHGNYQNLESIRQSKAIPDSMWQRILPYLALDSVAP
jgi:DNA uptake protein ComE-like DNA-binding protein